MLGGLADLLFEICVFLTGLLQGFRQLALPGIAVLQLFIGCFQRLLILGNGPLLERQFLLEGG